VEINLIRIIFRVDLKYTKKTVPDDESLVSNCRSEGMRNKKSLDPKIIEQYLKYRKTFRKSKN
jgi:hypothetical protein